MSDRVVHFEIPFDDGDRARGFYRDVFGWELMELPEMDYTMVTSGPSGDQGPTEPGYINGGMNSRSRSPSTSPVIVIDVPDIAAKCITITEAGGRVVSDRQPVGDMGFAAYVEDPEGNVIGLWETAKPG